MPSLRETQVQFWLSPLNDQLRCGVAKSVPRIGTTRVVEKW